MRIKSVKPATLQCMYCLTDLPAIWDAAIEEGGQTYTLLLCDVCMGQAIRNNLDLSRWLKPEKKPKGK